MFYFPLPVFVCFPDLLSVCLCCICLSAHVYLHLLSFSLFVIGSSCVCVLVSRSLCVLCVPSVFSMAFGLSWVLFFLIHCSFNSVLVSAISWEKIGLFSCLMLRYVLQLMANFVCLPFVAQQFIYQRCFSKKSFLLWLKTVDESAETR